MSDKKSQVVLPNKGEKTVDMLAREYLLTQAESREASEAWSCLRKVAEAAPAADAAVGRAILAGAPVHVTRMKEQYAVLAKHDEPIATYTLFIWELVPDEVTLYYVPNEILTEEDFQILRTANGHYMNSEEVTLAQTSALQRLSDATVEKAEYLSEEEQATETVWRMRFQKYKEEEGTEASEDKIITRVYRAGWYL